MACLVALVWVSELVLGHDLTLAHRTLLGVCGLYAVAALAYYRFLENQPQRGVLVQYGFLIADPAMLVLVLAADPNHFDFLNSFVSVVIVRSGIRYGVRTMWLVWSCASLLAAGLIPATDYWRSHLELSLTFAVTLGLIPLFFVANIIACTASGRSSRSAPDCKRWTTS